MSTIKLSKIYRWSNNIQYSLLPGTCILCKKLTHRQSDLCLQCKQCLPFNIKACLHCGLKLPFGKHKIQVCGSCLIHLPPFKYTISCFEYRPPIDRLISQFKFHCALAAGKVLTQLMLIHIRKFYQYQDLPDLLIPVPLHKKRIRQRGYNQAQEIARLLGWHLNIPVSTDYCQRSTDTEPQRGLSAAKRKKNLQGAFSLTNKIIAPNTTIAIIDDVVTTMVTATQLSLLLLDQGAQEIHLWSLARTNK